MQRGHVVQGHQSRTETLQRQGQQVGSAEGTRLQVRRSIGPVSEII